MPALQVSKKMVFPRPYRRRSHPFPSRTRKLSSSGPMVLHGQLCGRVGRRGIFKKPPNIARCWGVLRFVVNKSFDRKQGEWYFIYAYFIYYNIYIIKVNIIIMPNNIIIPDGLQELLSAKRKFSGAVDSIIADFEVWLSANKLIFFPEYTDHGVDQIGF